MVVASTAVASSPVGSVSSENSAFVPVVGQVAVYRRGMRSTHKNLLNETKH
jgi:hypothetical protein